MQTNVVVLIYCTTYCTLSYWYTCTRIASNCKHINGSITHNQVTSMPTSDVCNLAWDQSWDQTLDKSWDQTKKVPDQKACLNCWLCHCSMLLPISRCIVISSSLFGQARLYQRLCCLRACQMALVPAGICWGKRLLACHNYHSRQKRHPVRPIMQEALRYSDNPKLSFHMYT